MNKHMTTLILGSYDRQGKSALLGLHYNVTWSSFTANRK
jgi:hypothetical protein